VKTSPMQRSLKHLRDAGWTCAIVEHWNLHAKIRQDLFGFGDILACEPGTDEAASRIYNTFGGSGIALVQTTTQANAAARLAKIIAEPRAKTWLLVGGRIFLHGWRKIGPRGKRKLWDLKEREVTLLDFQETPCQDRLTGNFETSPARNTLSISGK